MGKRYTYEEVKAIIENEGYELLSDEYVNSHTKLRVKCPKGHEYEVILDKFKLGRRCPICSKNRKYTYDEVKSFIESIGYELVSKEYKNARTKLHMICNNGHEYNAPLYSLKQGFRCGRCKKRVRYEYGEVKSFVEKEKYILLSKEYKNNKTLLDMRCPKGHIHKTTFDNFKRGYRCKKCFLEHNIGSNHPNWLGGYNSRNIPRFDTYAPQLDWCEEVRRDPKDKNVLQVRCTESSCRKWFTPTCGAVQHRIKSLNGRGTGECRFYCSEKCKQKCSVFGRHKYPKNFISESTIREVQPELRKLVFERDDYRCQKCGSNRNLECHHIFPVSIEPIESADIDTCMTLCKECHRKLHQQKGCTNRDLTYTC